MTHTQQDGLVVGKVTDHRFEQRQGDTLARTGNTARDQEMYAAGIRTGEENAKHNAAIRAGMPDGWKLVPVKATDEMEAAAENDYGQTGYAFPRWKSHYAAMLAAAPAAPGVSTVEAQPVAWMDPDTQDVISAERKASWLNEYGAGGAAKAATYTRALGDLRPAPAAGDALDAARYRFLLEKSTVSMGYASLCAFSARNRDTDFFSREEGLQALESAIDAAIAAQRKGDA
ncbi:hypothetical protein ACOTJD_30115 [Achromobacter xylosoxidans]